MYYEIKRIVGDTWLAEDILQSTVLNLINNIDTLRELPPTKLASYIVSASRNNALTQLRNDRRHPHEHYDDWGAIPDCIDSNSNPEFYLSKKDEYKLLIEVWDKLDNRSKYLLRGKYILNKSYDDLGKDLQIKPESVRMALTRARRFALSLIKEKES